MADYSRDFLPWDNFRFLREPGMNCPRCQFDNREGIKFCEQCGTKIEIECPHCRAKIPPGRTFCGECGHDQRKPKEAPPVDYSQPRSYTPKFLADKILTSRSAIEGERKLVTVLFADVANYTSISEKLDPEEVHQLMDGCFQILMNEVHRFEGTINQFTGDGIMALFGAPVAHEDHAQRACHAALSIQKAVGEYGKKIQKDMGIEFQIRLGMNSGPVIVGSIGDDLRMDYTAVGDTTNLAFRMQSMANAGSIRISKNTYKIASDFFAFESLGKVAVKGKEETQGAYILLGTSNVETRIEASAVKGLTRFVGRKKEIAALQESCEKARSGSGQVVGIVGEAGVGKSRLLLELRDTLLQEDQTCLEGRCLHYGGSMPYLPILDILKSYFHIQEGDREGNIKQKILNRFVELDEKLTAIPACLHDILSLKVEDEGYPRLDPEQKREMTFEAVRDLLIRASQRSPLIVAVEDLHWIDKTSEEFLDYLIGWLPNTPILLMLLHRPEYTHHWGSKSYFTQVSLGQLSTRTSAELVQAILEEGRVVPELKKLILDKAGGNPLFVEELTHSLLENGSIHRQEDQYVLSRSASEIDVPETIQGIIAARMDRVEENLKRIMQVASVIGREFAYRILEAITEMREELKASLLNLQGLEFIYEKQLFPELEYIFKHALTQEVAYGSLLLKRRKEIHGKIGQAIEQIYSERLEEYYELLAYHYVRSTDTAKAVEYLTLANKKVVLAYAVEDAKAYFDQAMELLDTLPETGTTREQRISLVTSQLIVFEQLLKVPEWYELLIRYKPLATKVNNPGLAGWFYVGLEYCQNLFGYFDQAIASGEKAVELYEATAEVDFPGAAYMLLEWPCLFKGDLDRVLALKEQSLHRMRDHGFSHDVYVRGVTGASGAYQLFGLWNEAEEEGQKALKVARESSHGNLISFAAYTLTLAYTYKGDLSLAIQHGELALANATGLAFHAYSQIGLAWAWCRAGELDKGIETLAALVPVVRAGRVVVMEIFGAMALSEGYLLAGEYDQARQTAEELRELAERCGARVWLGVAYRLLGQIALETSLMEAGTFFEKSIAISKEIKAENELALACAGLGRLHKKQGEISKARQFLTQALKTFERLGTMIEPDKVRKELAELSEVE